MLLILDSTSRTLKAKMDVAATTTNCSVVVAYADNSGTTFTEGAVPSVLNGTTSVTILPAPAAGVRRVVKSVCVYNPDSQTHTTTLIFNDNATEYPITRLTLAPGASWSSDDQTGASASGSMVYPGAGVAVSTGSAWGTSKASPSGDIVGTTDSQALTNKTINGASNTLSDVNLASQVTGTLPVANGGTGATTSTGSGSVVLATSPSLTTPSLGVATGTSFNSITGLSSTTPIIDGTAAIGTGTTAARADHVHPTDTSRAATSGTLAQFAATTSAQLAGVISDETGSGALVFANSPTMTTPNIGAATGTSFNSITALSSTTPSADSGSGVVGTSTTVARADHQHPVSGVTSFSAGSTGLTPSTGTAGAVTLAGTLAVANGGTGATTAGGALTSLGAYAASNPSGYTSNTGTVTGVTGTSPVASSGGTAPAISLASGYGDTQNPYGSKAANSFLAAPDGTAAAPTFRAIVAADIPTLNQNTTGTASNVSGTVAVANGGTGQTSYSDGQLLIGNTSTGGLAKAALTAGSNITITNGAGAITIASTGGGSSLTNSNISPTSANVTAAVNYRYFANISGLTANRDFILPTPAVGDTIQISIVTEDDTYALILKGDTGITINGGSAATEWSRLFIKNETVTFVANTTSNWQVLTDGRIPSTARIAYTGTTYTPAIAHNFSTQVILNTVVFDNGSFADTTNSRLKIRRTSKYVLAAALRYASISAEIRRMTCWIGQFDTGAIIQLAEQYAASTTASPGLSIATVIEMVEGKQLLFNAYQFSANSGTQAPQSGAGYPHLEMTEVLT